MPGRWGVYSVERFKVIGGKISPISKIKNDDHLCLGEIGRSQDKYFTEINILNIKRG